VHALRKPASCALAEGHPGSSPGDLRDRRPRMAAERQNLHAVCHQSSSGTDSSHFVFAIHRTCESCPRAQRGQCFLGKQWAARFFCISLSKLRDREQRQARATSYVRVSGKFCWPLCGTCSCHCISPEGRFSQAFSTDVVEDYTGRNFNKSSFYLVQQAFTYFLGLQQEEFR